jgi:hypothetical protein
MIAGSERQSNEEPGDNKTAAPATSVSWRGAPPYGIHWLGWRILAALIGGLILRLWMMRAFPQDGGDSLIYGDLAKNLLVHHMFAITDGSGVVHSTLIRLPGYPLFLSLCFRLFGIADYHAVAYLQMAMELASCLLLADFVRRISSSRAGLNTLWLAAMCPFTAVYSSAPLTESLTFDGICLALWSLQRYLGRNDESGFPNHESGRPTIAGPLFFRLRWVPNWAFLLLFTLAISSAALFRPDGALLAIALWPALIFSRRPGISFSKAMRPALLCGILSVLPFAVWSARNWSTFHVFEPLAPRYANDPGESPHPGWQHWVKTWCLDFTCTNEIYWNVPDGAISFDDLPAWAMDSPQQQQQTWTLFNEYNRDEEISPALDAEFEALAHQRAATHSLRTWILLPLGRLADMTLRPRVENLTIDLRWWEYWNHRSETRFSIVYGIVNLLLLMLGRAGLARRPQLWQYMLAYLLLRCLLLLTIEAPETRYTLEFFPIVFAMAGIELRHLFAKKQSPRKAALNDSQSASPVQS